MNFENMTKSSSDNSSASKYHLQTFKIEQDAKQPKNVGKSPSITKIMQLMVKKCIPFINTENPLLLALAIAFLR